MSIVRAWIDWHIGWHQGRAAEHAALEQVWRRRYESRWPNPFRTTTPTTPPEQDESAEAQA